MRYLICLLLSFSSFYSYINAQNKIRFGITASGGTSIINLDPTEVRNQKIVYNFSGNWGLVFENQISSVFSLGF